MVETLSAKELDKHVEDLNRDGICILRGLFDRKTVEEWQKAFLNLYEKKRNIPGALAPREKGRFYFTFPFEMPFADPKIFAHPAILGVLNRVFAQEYELVQLAVDFPINCSEFQEMHRDYRPLFTDDFVTPLYALAVNFPLVDVTEENGPLHMSRGTHVMPKEESLKKIAAGEIPIESFPMQMGDVAIRTPLAMHRGTPNKTDFPRPMVVMGYVMHWLHTRNVDLKVPKAVYESFAPSLQKMIRCEVVEKLSDNATESYINFKY